MGSININIYVKDVAPPEIGYDICCPLLLCSCFCAVSRLQGVAAQQACIPLTFPPPPSSCCPPPPPPHWPHPPWPLLMLPRLLPPHASPPSSYFPLLPPSLCCLFPHTPPAPHVTHSKGHIPKLQSGSMRLMLCMCDAQACRLQKRCPSLRASPFVDSSLT